MTERARAATAAQTESVVEHWASAARRVALLVKVGGRVPRVAGPHVVWETALVGAEEGVGAAPVEFATGSAAGADRRVALLLRGVTRVSRVARPHETPRFPLVGLE